MAKDAVKLILLVIVLVSLSPAAASALGVAGFDLYRPATENPDSAFHFDLTAGESKVEKLVLENTSETVQNVRIYVADAIASSNGGIALKERLDKKTGLAKWITLDSPEDIALEPGEKRLIKFTIDVPVTSENKEEMAGIVVERAAPLKSEGDQQFQINIISRAAILVSQRLPGPAIERLKIIDFDHHDGSKRNKVFDLTLKNTGNIHLKPRGSIQIYDMFGRKSNSIKIGQMPTVFPGMIGHISREWKNTPVIGYYTAEVNVAYGKNKSEKRRIAVFIFPWWVLPILLALWIIARQQRKRRAARKIQRIEDEKAIASDTAMDTLKKTVDGLEGSVLPLRDSSVQKTAVVHTDPKPALKDAITKNTAPKNRARQQAKKTTTKKSTTGATGTKKVLSPSSSEAAKKSKTKKKAVSKKTAPKKAVPKKTTPKKAAPKKPSAKKTTKQKRTTPKKASTRKKSALKKAAPKKDKK
ncbi:MAG TPA: DUF916 domain-containing protein [Actinobacteria bacterium]|nr:DUF916 domain-containing protein [Actinomycetota bacterium]